MTARGSGGVLQLLQWVRAERGRQTHFGAIQGPEFVNLFQFDRTANDANATF